MVGDANMGNPVDGEDGGAVPAEEIAGVAAAVGAVKELDVGAATLLELPLDGALPADPDPPAGMYSDSRL